MTLKETPPHILRQIYDEDQANNAYTPRPAREVWAERGCYAIMGFACVYFAAQFLR